MTKEYIIMLGTSYLIDYTVSQVSGTFEPEVIAEVRQKGAKYFKDKEKSNWAAKQLGGSAIELGRY